MICAESLRAASLVRDLNHSDLARAAGVSRQAVSEWFHPKTPGDAPIPVRSRTWENLSRALNLPLEEFSRPLPLTREESAPLTTLLLWDGLYPDLVAFAAAVVNEEPPALARLAQTYGLYAAAKAGGAAVWRRFPDYARHLHPNRRAELQRIWDLRSNPTPD